MRGQNHAELDIEDILSTERMFDQNKLTRTITMGISLLGCASSDEKLCVITFMIQSAVMRKDLAEVSHDISREYGVPIINRRISVTPWIALVAGGIREFQATFRLLKHSKEQLMKSV